jgi:hypothetical protein
MTALIGVQRVCREPEPDRGMKADTLSLPEPGAYVQRAASAKIATASRCGELRGSRPIEQDRSMLQSSSTGMRATNKQSSKYP